MNPFQGPLAACAVTALFLAQLSHAQEPSEPGFESIFNGDDLSGWDGDDRFWKVEDGILIGQTTESVSAEKNTFLIHRGGTYGDFELRFRYQVEGFNSGVQYRSTDEGDYVMKGLQADFEAQWHDGNSDKFSGMFFEENGRMFMGQRGDVVIVRANHNDPKKPRIEKLGSVGDPAELENVIHRDGWNDYTVIASGNKFIHMINGRVMSIGIDEDELNFRADGLIGFQLHSGPPMKIQVKDIRIRELEE